MSTAVIDPPAECANCGASLQGPYCAQCGQKATTLNPTLGEFLHDLFHEIAHVLSVLCFGITAIAPAPGVRIGCSSCPPELRAEREREMGEGLAHWAPRAMFVLVPVFAGLVALVARRSGRRYPEHLYFSMHVHAAWFFAGIVVAATGYIAVPWVRPVVAVVAVLYAGGYFARAFGRVYRTGFFVTALGTAAISAIYTGAVLLAVLAILLPIALRR